MWKVVKIISHNPYLIHNTQVYYTPMLPVTSVFTHVFPSGWNLLILTDVVVGVQHVLYTMVTFLKKTIMRSAVTSWVRKSLRPRILHYWFGIQQFYSWSFYLYQKLKLSCFMRPIFWPTQIKTWFFKTRMKFPCVDFVLRFNISIYHIPKIIHPKRFNYHI